MPKKTHVEIAKKCGERADIKNYQNQLERNCSRRILYPLRAAFFIRRIHTRNRNLVIAAL